MSEESGERLLIESTAGAGTRKEGDGIGSGDWGDGGLGCGGGGWLEIVITKGALAGFLPPRPELLALLTLYWLGRDGFSRGVGSFRDGSEDLAWSSNLRLGQPEGVKPGSGWSCGSATQMERARATVFCREVMNTPLCSPVWACVGGGE